MPLTIDNQPLTIDKPPMPSVVAAQLYTVRQFTQTPADIARTLKRIKNIGYDAVQLSALGPIDAPELRRILDAEGLTCCATHEPWEQLRDHPDAVIERHRTLNCRHTAVGRIPKSYTGEAGYRAFAHDASEVARRLHAAGITWAYHNHSFELERFGRNTGLDILFESSDRRVFHAEIDTYWIQHGGGDPAAWIRNLKGRVPLVHLKDMAVATDPQSPNGSTQSVMAEVGEGNLNWSAILQACRDAGVCWYIVEQDSCRRDPFESLAISLSNLRAMGLT